MKIHKLIILTSICMTLPYFMSVHAFTWKDPYVQQEVNNICLFNWLEMTYPSLFKPANQQTLFITAENEKVDYRYYRITDSFIAAWKQKLYYIGIDDSDTDYKLFNLGPLNDWYFLSGCQSAHLKLYLQTQEFTISGPARTRWKEIGLPYKAEMVTRMALTGTDIISHGKFKLEAIGDSFVITGVEVGDLLDNTWAMAEGLPWELGDITINPGDEIVFELISGRHGELPSIINFSFMVEGMGQVFSLIMHFESSTYPLRYYRDYPYT